MQSAGTIPPHYIIARLYPGCVFKNEDQEYEHAEQAITITAEDGTRLSGWFFNRGEGTPLVAMYCGNGMNAGDFHLVAREDTASSYLLINYRGYGSSEGIPGESHIVADARHCLNVARGLMNNRPGPLYLVGYSLGSGVAVQVAAAEKPDKLILITPFDKYANVIHLPEIAEYPGFADWNSAAVAPSITCPVTIMQAEHDTIVRPSSTAALVQAFSKPPEVRCYDAEHCDILFADGFLHDLIKQFSKQTSVTPKKYKWLLVCLIIVIILLILQFLTSGVTHTMVYPG